MDNDFDPTPGFFGKVMTHGDFVSRWLDTYLTSPIWRFVLAPGVCDNRAWAGVLMPSVDRVGRHFPLTIAAGATSDGAILDWVGSGKEWFDQLEDLALSSLADGFV